MSGMLDTVANIGEQVAGRHAADVDRLARFPRETFDSLRQAGVLGAAVPQTLGGEGASVASLTEMCRALGRHCASSGLILAMHHIQVLSIVRHMGEVAELADYLRRLVREQRLVASATSEVGPGGNVRQSVAAVRTEKGALSVAKHATTISYGAHADDILLSARRSEQAAGGEQVAVLALGGGYELSDPSTWDTLGMRGTCSSGARLKCTFEPWQVLPASFGEIAGQTMVPTSHVIWSGAWLGVADSAVSIAAAAVRKRARSTPGQTPSSARALDRATRRRSQLIAEVEGIARRYDTLCADGDPAALTQLGFVLAVNDLKLSASTGLVDVVTQCVRAVGMMAYKNDSPLSLGRQLRDAHSAALMINNDRIEDTNQAILLVHKGD